MEKQPSFNTRKLINDMINNNDKEMKFINPKFKSILEKEDKEEFTSDGLIGIDISMIFDILLLKLNRCFIYLDKLYRKRFDKSVRENKGLMVEYLDDFELFLNLISNTSITNDHVKLLHIFFDSFIPNSNIVLPGYKELFLENKHKLYDLELNNFSELMRFKYDVSFIDWFQKEEIVNDIVILIKDKVTLDVQEKINETIFKFVDEDDIQIFYLDFNHMPEDDTIFFNTVFIDDSGIMIDIFNDNKKADLIHTIVVGYGYRCADNIYLSNPDTFDHFKNDLGKRNILLFVIPRDQQIDEEILESMGNIDLEKEDKKISF